jgi:hypothetical protein
MDKSLEELRQDNKSNNPRKRQQRKKRTNDKPYKVKFKGNS